MNDECLKTCKELCPLIAPSGYEIAVSSYIRKALIGNGKGSYFEDKMGNILFTFNGEKKLPPVALLAHMDSAGIFTTTDEQEKSCRFGSLSKYNKEKTDKQLFKFMSGAEAVIDFENKTVIRQGTIPLRKGDFGVFFPSFENTSEELIGTFLDDRVICALMLNIIAQMIKTDKPVIFIFTVQEEIGNKGAKAIASYLEADRVYVLDTTICEAHEPAPVPVRGKGACLKICDGSGMCSYALNKEVLEIAKQKGVSIQLELLDFAGSDIAAFSGASANYVFTGISIPCHNMHSPCEKMSLSDIDSFNKLLQIILEETCGACFEN